MLTPELVSVWLRVVVGVLLSLYPVTFPELGVQVQVKSVPFTFDVSVVFGEVLLQICFDGGELVRSGFETRVTTKSVTGPSQPFACGVM